MGTDSNKELLAHIGLDTPEVKASKPDELAIVIKAENEKAALDALAQVDGLLAARKSQGGEEYRPRSIESAADAAPVCWLGDSFPLPAAMQLLSPVNACDLANMFISSATMSPLK
jgi:hypothetical protein